MMRAFQWGIWLAFAALIADTTAGLLVPQISPEGGLVHSPALVTISNLNPSGVVFYTLDGSDPRDHFGNVFTNARTYSHPISVNHSLVIRARARLGTNWSALVAAPFTADRNSTKLLFTEIMFHPRNADDEQVEFVELKNVGDVALDLSGLEFGSTQASSRALPAGTNRLPAGAIGGPGQFYILANDSNYFHSVYPGVRVDADFSLSAFSKGSFPFQRTR